jgi:hypothetical protein
MPSSYLKIALKFATSLYAKVEERVDYSNRIILLTDMEVISNQ